MYTKEERALRAEWISPCDDALAALDRPRAAGFPGADWIWPLGCTRFHAFRLFTPKKPVRRAELAMACGNALDVWLDGQAAGGEERDGDGAGRRKSAARARVSKPQL